LGAAAATGLAGAGVAGSGGTLTTGAGLGGAVDLIGAVTGLGDLSSALGVLIFFFGYVNNKFQNNRIYTQILGLLTTRSQFH